MVEVTKPMGSYHIIDGEKVSVKYRGQGKTCARCHKTESVCPGRAMARDCTSERVLLSTHMEEHWEKVGYKPDTLELNEVDELDVQIGRKEPEPLPSADSLRPDHTSKYTSVMINGFSKTVKEQDIYDILLEGGLPADYKIEDIRKNDKNGQLIIDTLDSEVCIKLTKHIHGNKFFSRKVYVTSVVQKTPSKESQEAEEANDCPNKLADSSASGSDSSDDEEATVEKPPCSNLFSRVSAPAQKRPAGASPEVTSETKQKDKKKKSGNASASVRSSSRQGQGKTASTK